MNRLFPLDYKNFRRFSVKLRKTVDLTRTATPQALARACGFSTFHEITLSDRARSQKAVPMTFRCAGEIKFVVWVEQRQSVFGRGAFQNLASESLRTWYAKLFEVGTGVPPDIGDPQLDIPHPFDRPPLRSDFFDIYRSEARHACEAVQQCW